MSRRQPVARCSRHGPASPPAIADARNRSAISCWLGSLERCWLCRPRRGNPFSERDKAQPCVRRRQRPWCGVHNAAPVGLPGISRRIGLRDSRTFRWRKS